MKIGVIGAQNTGKTTLISDMIKRWPMYTVQDKTYRDVLKERKLPCNQETTPETQQLIMDFLCDQCITTNTGHIIHDRTPIDALAYSMYAYLKGNDGFDDEFLKRQILMAKEAIKFYNILFYIPVDTKYDIPLVSDTLRDTTPEYRTEMGNIFSEIVRSYHSGVGLYFDNSDCPAVIDIYGAREDRIKLCEFYINESGNMYGEDESLIADDIYVPDEYKK